MANPSSSIRFGATRTTTLTTSVTISKGETTYSLYYPQPLISQATEYTTLPSPLSPGVEWIRTSLPVLVLTEVIGIGISTNAVPLATHTIIQSPPEAGGNYVGIATGCSRSWSCYTQGQQAGIVIAAVLGFLFLLGVILFSCICWPLYKRMIRKERRDEENGYRGPLDYPGSEGGSSSSSSNVYIATQPPRPRGDSTVPSYRVVRDQPPVQRDKPPNAPIPTRTASQRERERAYRLPNEPQQPDPPSATSARDWALPLAAGVAGAAIGTGEGRKKRVNTRPPPVWRYAEEIPDPEMFRVGGSMRTGQLSPRQQQTRPSAERHEQRDARRSREYSDMNGLQRTSSSRRHSAEADDVFQDHRRSSRRHEHSHDDLGRRRPRSHSPPSREEAKRKDKKGGTGKLWALVGLGLAAINILSEPKGGWEQYGPKKNKNSKEKVMKHVQEAEDSVKQRVKEHLRTTSIERSRSVDRAYESTHPHRARSAAEERAHDRYPNPSYDSSRRTTPSSRHGEDPRFSRNEIILTQPGSDPSTVSIPMRRRSSRRSAERRADNYGTDGAQSDGDGGIQIATGGVGVLEHSWDSGHTSPSLPPHLQFGSDAPSGRLGNHLMSPIPGTPLASPSVQKAERSQLSRLGGSDPMTPPDSNVI